MTAGELIEMLKTVAPDTEIIIEGRDLTGEVIIVYKMTAEHIYIGWPYIVIYGDYGRKNNVCYSER